MAWPENPDHLLPPGRGGSWRVRLPAAAWAAVSRERVAPLPLLDAGLLTLKAGVATKAEAIRLAAEQLFESCRAKNVSVIEEALWRREGAGSTGFGFGFAIPHCRSSAVVADSLLVIKPRVPLSWDAPDDLPVKVIFVLAVRAASQGREHLQILARLARLLMEVGFRERLATETQAQRLSSFLSGQLKA